jgi:hypothetical protein
MSKSHKDATLTYTQRSVAFPHDLRSDFNDGVSDEIGVSLDAPDGGTYGEMNWQFKTFNFYSHGVQMRVFGDGLLCLSDPRVQRVVAKWQAQTKPDDALPSDFIVWLEAEGIVPSRYQIRGQQEAKE